MFCLWKSPASHCCGAKKILRNNNLFQEPAVSILSPNSKFSERVKNLSFKILTVIYKLPPKSAFDFYWSSKLADAGLVVFLIWLSSYFLFCLLSGVTCFHPIASFGVPLQYPLMKRENRNILAKSISSWRASRTVWNRSSLSRLIYVHVL